MQLREIERISESRYQE